MKRRTILCSRFSPCWSHLAYPDQWKHMSDRPRHRGLPHLLFLNNVNGLFQVPFQLKYKDEGNKANGLTSSSNDSIIWTEKGVLRDDSQRRCLAQHSAGMLEQCFYHTKQCRSNVATLHCASRVTSPLVTTTTSCKNVETLRRKSSLSYLKSLLVTRLWEIIISSPSPPSKIVPLSFEHGLVLLATLIRRGGGSQAQDHGQAIRPKLVSQSVFATGCTIRPWVLVRPGFELTASRSEDRSSSNGANRAAVLTLIYSS